MNKRYVLVRDKIVVDLDKDKKKIIDYRDNANDVLIQENVVEAIEKQLQFAKDSIKYLQKSLDQDKYSIKDVILFFILPAIALVFFKALSPSIDSVLIDTFLGKLPQSSAALIYASPFILLLSTILVSINHIPRAKYIKKIKGFQAQIEGLTTQLEKEKAHLNNLINKKTQNNMKDISNNNELETINVNDENALNNLELTIKTYHLCGVKEKTFLKAYKSALLDEQLKRRRYCCFERAIIIDYIEQKVKRKSAH